MKKKIDNINNMSRDEAIEYLKKIHLSTLTGQDRIILIEACERRIDHLNRDKSMVTKADFD